MRNMPTASQIESGLGPRKTVIIMVTLVGCLAILWPKVFYPMMFGGTPKQNLMKDHRATDVACCGVVVDRGAFRNVSSVVAESTEYHKTLNLLTGEMSLRQERPPHLRPESIHPAMRERGRAIPTPTVPIIERARAPASPPRIVEGRPGPIPGMRPPMGAGSVHQAQPKSNSMGFIMPLYTVGIVAFFVYTVMRIVFKKRIPNAPYGPARHDPKFRQEVFGHEPVGYRRPDDGTTKLGLIDATDEQLKRREMSASLNKESSENSNQNGNISNGHAKPIATITSTPLIDIDKPLENKDKSDELIKKEQQAATKDETKKKEQSNEKSVKVLGMELTIGREGGQKWVRPPTPIFISHSPHSDEPEDIRPEPKSIYLEGSLPHESQILVADTETHTEPAVGEDMNGSAEEPAAILSSKITLSLINLHTASDSDAAKAVETPSDKDSPIDQDIEIVNGEDNEEFENK